MGGTAEGAGVVKVYKLTVMVLDHDELGADEIARVLHDQRYPNHCINPVVMACEGREIGEWDDDHPLNTGAQDAEFARLFGEKGPAS